MGGKFHLKLNIGSRPIANKYHEGKVKRTLKRELKVPEIAEREANGTSVLGEIVASSRAWCFSPCLSAPVHNRGNSRQMIVRPRAFECAWQNSFVD